MESATHRDIRKMTGLTNRKIQYLASEYGIEPEPGTGEGRGTVRRYTPEAQFDFLLASKLSDFGMKPRSIRIILDKIHDMPVKLEPAKLQPGIEFLVVYERESGRFIKLDTPIKSSKNISLELKLIADFESCIVIDLGKLASRMVF